MTCLRGIQELPRCGAQIWGQTLMRNLVAHHVLTTGGQIGSWNHALPCIRWQELCGAHAAASTLARDRRERMKNAKKPACVTVADLLSMSDRCANGPVTQGLLEESSDQINATHMQLGPGSQHPTTDLPAKRQRLLARIHWIPSASGRSFQQDLWNLVGQEQSFPGCTLVLQHASREMVYAHVASSRINA